MLCVVKHTAELFFAMANQNKLSIILFVRAILATFISSSNFIFVPYREYNIVIRRESFVFIVMCGGADQSNLYVMRMRGSIYTRNQ